MKGKRILEFNGKKKELNAYNIEVKNYYSVTEVAELLDKKVVYDNVTKVTRIV